MAQAVQIGAGNIGRGFLGQLLFEGGYETTFVDSNVSLVEQLNARSSYPLRLVSDGASETLTIANLHALNASERAATTAALVQADLVSTAVGVNVLPKIAPLLAAGINARAIAKAGPLNILLCENQWHAATMMHELLEPHIAPQAHDYFVNQVGLVETVIGRMVPAPTDALRAEDPLLIVAEPYKELPIAKDRLRGPAPTLPGLVLADNFEAYEARKLFLHNMGHAGFAYLGFACGYQYVWQCACDADIERTCRAALGETAKAMAGRYGFRDDELNAFADDLIHRFRNQALGDTVARVAADPLRKLRPSDRLIGAAELCLNSGVDLKAMSQIIAAALRYDNPTDPSARELQRRRRAEGDQVLLSSLCEIPADSKLGTLVLRALERPAHAP